MGHLERLDGPPSVPIRLEPLGIVRLGPDLLNSKLERERSFLIPMGLQRQYPSTNIIPCRRAVFLLPLANEMGEENR